ncbi:hypothetical protein [Orenia marismortui]|uniref:hypothetical protein n=1 Tax=Orenia marismortui TaxID=46469 RepID=UPI00036E8663|nr:hypothetical protein [Orenia marismortui]
MINIEKKIQKSDLNKELLDYLDRKFQTHLELKDDSGSSKHSKYLKNKMEEWGKGFEENLPSDLKDYFIYITASAGNFSYYNLNSRILFKYIFPSFFKEFDSGQIWIVETEAKWRDISWSSQHKLAQENDLGEIIGEYPHEFTGMQEENFPEMSIDILTYALYPLMPCEVVHLAYGLSLIFIPDCVFEYSQMKEADTLYNHLLWKMHHIFDDQWTFNSMRGPKSALSKDLFSFEDLLNFFEWYINLLSDKLKELLSIKESYLRQQRVMTLNSILCDMFFSITSQLPYLAKTSLFSMLDKVSNFLKSLEYDESESNLWKMILSEEFLEEEIKDKTKNVPGEVGRQMKLSIEWALDQIKLDNLDENLLRDFRNCNHGYLLNDYRWEKLCRHNGEINNDITLLSFPIWLYLISLDWKKVNKK